MPKTWKAWTPEEVEFLQTRKAAGDSATLIGKEIQKSRNAVMSKAEKLGLGEWKSTQIGSRGRLVDSEWKGNSRKPVAKPSPTRKITWTRSFEKTVTKRLSKDELRTMLAEAVQRTAAM